ncbi:hypothetical protein CHELA20_40102 [Hyphomicrobiales bacterium]|nr:hypothetical protein CHELA20_40102 [Hyphomicrobiales bacterium]CAH1687158.1 hypothetical protein CHELA41_30132 [Hyphomicrobiales bacterium]
MALSHAMPGHVHGTSMHLGLSNDDHF